MGPEQPGMKRAPSDLGTWARMEKGQISSVVVRPCVRFLSRLRILPQHLEARCDRTGCLSTML